MTNIPNTRGRKPRSEMTMEERRARMTNIGETNKRLATGGLNLDTDKYSYRWVNDDGTKLYEKLNNDVWDFVSSEGVSIGSDKGESVSVQVGTKANGEPLLSYLMQKPKEYYDEDKAAGQVAVDEKMNQIRKGAEGGGAGVTGDSYNPSDGITLK